MNYKLQRLVLLFIAVVGLGTGAVLVFTPVSAQAAEGEFYLQVSPSPLVATLKPGQTSTLDLKVRNAGTQTEKLTISPQSFTVNSNGSVAMNDTKRPEVADWITFSAKDFTVDPGEWFEQKVTVAVPKDAGFSYSFALVVTRQDSMAADIGKGQELKGKVAVFALLNVDKPGAVRELQLESLKSEAGIYEYLPATLHLRLKNTGNTIVQPAGDVFIQRKSDDKKPIDTVAVNDGGGYILPGTVRTLAINWNDGFPVIKEDADMNPPKKYTDWDWSRLADFRFGRYTAKAVVIYNDGQRDIPLVAEVGFWVIPWKIVLGLLIIIALILFGVWSIVRQIMRLSKRNKRPVRLGEG